MPVLIPLLNPAAGKVPVLIPLIRLAEIPKPLEPDVLEANLDLFLAIGNSGTRWIEQCPLWLGCRVFPVQMRTELRPPILLAGREITEIGHHTLPRASRRAIRLDQRSIGVPLAALPSFTASQKHRSTPSPGCFKDHDFMSQNSSPRSSLHGVSRDRALSREDVRSVKDPKTWKMVPRWFTWAISRKVPVLIPGKCLS